ncbi:MAG TPA: cupredoxin domain-containing protein [Candidatus Saccharimonadales bacterium]|nr:cupredoxin domain-containing protein [Candidatus Saccharimonadales bacterium]
MNKKIIVALVVVFVLGAGAWAYMATRPNASAPQSTNPDNRDHTDSSPSESPVATTELHYTDSGFSPKSITAKVGTKIHITNQSSVPLQFSSDDHPTHTLHPEFNLGTIAAGADEELELKTVGTWGYHNHLKSEDTGSITVTE